MSVVRAAVAVLAARSGRTPTSSRASRRTCASRGPARTRRSRGRGRAAGWRAGRSTPPCPACVSQPPASVNATSRPTSELMSCAIWRSERRRAVSGRIRGPVLGRDARRGPPPPGSAPPRRTPARTRRSGSAADLAYIASKVSAAASPIRRGVRSARGGRCATAPAAPARMRGMRRRQGRGAQRRGSPRRGARRARAPGSRPGSSSTPGVPDSMKSCASKWERVGSGVPAACTKAAAPSRKKGEQGSQRRVEPEEPVEVEGGAVGRAGPRHGDRRPPA